MISFDTGKKLQKYKIELSKENVTTKIKLDAAIFYSGLSSGKGLNFTAPVSIDSAYFYTSVLPNLSSNERKIFQHVYGKTKYNAVGLLKQKYSYNEFSSDDSLQHVLKSALLRTGYYGNIEYKECWQHVDLARRLFNEVITAEPENADAWLAYMENAYRIHPEGCNPCKGGFNLRTGGNFQNEIASEAYRHCPDNARIRQWHNFASPHTLELPDTVGKLDQQAKDYIVLSIKHGSGRGSLLPRISPDEFNVLKTKYRITDDQYIVKTNMILDDQTKHDIVDILYRCKYYHLRLCCELNAIEDDKKN
jgi:hypothetical protein